jgi:hypothetical protein
MSWVNSRDKTTRPWLLLGIGLDTFTIMGNSRARRNITPVLGPGGPGCPCHNSDDPWHLAPIVSERAGQVKPERRATDGLHDRRIHGALRKELARKSLELAISSSSPDNISVNRRTIRTRSENHRETLRGKAGSNDQGSDSSRGSKASPRSRHATSARAPATSKEGDGAPRDGHNPAPGCGGLEAPPGGCASDPAGVRGRREGCAAFASTDSEFPEAPWAESDSSGTTRGCERASRCSLGSWKLDASSQKPWVLGGATEAWEARSQGVTRSPSQGDGGAQASHSQACAEAQQEDENIEPAPGGGTAAARTGDLSQAGARRGRHA